MFVGPVLSADLSWHCVIGRFLVVLCYRPISCGPVLSAADLPSRQFICTVKLFLIIRIIVVSR